MTVAVYMGTPKGTQGKVLNKSINQIMNTSQSIKEMNSRVPYRFYAIHDSNGLFFLLRSKHVG